MDVFKRNGCMGWYITRFLSQSEDRSRRKEDKGEKTLQKGIFLCHVTEEAETLS